MTDYAFEGSNKLRAKINGQLVRASVTQQGTKLTVICNDVKVLHFFIFILWLGFSLSLNCLPQNELRLPESVFTRGGAVGKGTMAPLAGTVVKVLVNPKSTVAKHTPIIVMNALKMDHVIRAPADGVVDSVLFKVGDFVQGFLSSFFVVVAAALSNETSSILAAGTQLVRFVAAETAEEDATA